MGQNTQMWTAQRILDTLSSHKDRLRALGVRRIGLFGSYRHGTSAPESDMDFLVVLDPVSFDAYMEVKFFLEDIFNCRVDLVLERNLKPRLREAIPDEALYVAGF